MPIIRLKQETEKGTGEDVRRASSLLLSVLLFCHPLLLRTSLFISVMSGCVLRNKEKTLLPFHLTSGSSRLHHLLRKALVLFPLYFQIHWGKIITP